MSQYVARITAGGVTYSMPFADHEWAITMGFSAPIQSWVMPAEYANGILSAIGSETGTGREATLELGELSSLTTVKRVIVLGTAPADNPQRLQLLLTDVRWYFTRAWMLFDANVRRRIGDTRLVGDTITGAGGATTGTVADSVAYAPWSINNGSAYTWTTLKDQVLGYLTAPRHGRPGISWVTDTLSLDIHTQTVQETTTDAEGTVGLARAISSVPGANIYVDYDGVVHVCDSKPGAETTMVQALPPPLWRHGDLQLINNSGLRPTTWRIYVDYAIEMRFDYNPPVSSANPLFNVLALTHLENVVQVTDISLNVPAGSWGAARTVGEGTWLTLDEAFAAWGTKTYGPLPLPQLTDDIVADHWYGDALQRYTVGGGITTQDSIWSLRIGALMRSFRTTFRINPTFWEKIRHFWNVRTAVWDPVTGTRAASPVYSNFNYTILDNFVASNIQVFGQNVTDSYSTDGTLKTCKNSGFRVKIVDEELGIIEIERDERRFQGHTKIAPSPVSGGATTFISTAAAGSNEAVLQKLVHLSDPWRLATVLSCSPASPNDLRRVYEIKVDITDAAATAGIVAPDSFGPDQEMRSHIGEARVPWQDEKALQLALTFGGTSDLPDIGTDDPITSLTPINLNDELIPLGRAMAAADLLSKLDHYEGARAVPMSSSLVPIGSVNKITHRVTSNRAVSVVHADAAPPHFNAIDFLPASARKFLLKEIQGAR